MTSETNRGQEKILNYEKIAYSRTFVADTSACLGQFLRPIVLCFHFSENFYWLFSIVCFSANFAAFSLFGVCSCEKTAVFPMIFSL